MELPYIIAGFGVGCVVGLTGIGGGALMTPALVLLFGVAPHVAVGTDLVFACITKLVGVGMHGYRGSIDWQIVRRLSLGSVPAAIVTLLVLYFAGTTQARSGAIMDVLAMALMVTAVGLLARAPLHKFGRRLRTTKPASFKRLQPGLTVVAGVVVGILVTLTSVGAGALGTVVLLYLYPLRLNPVKLVGTDLAHAIPLALIAGFGHFVLGNIDLGLLGQLLLGSIPGVLLGSTLGLRASDAFVRNSIAVVLLVVACKIMLA